MKYISLFLSLVILTGEADSFLIQILVWAIGMFGLIVSVALIEEYE